MTVVSASPWHFRSRTALLGLLAVASLAACQVAVEPQRPMRGRSEDVRLDLRRIDVGPNVFVFDSHAAVLRRLRLAYYTVPTRVPCSGGVQARAITVDGEDGDRDQLPGGNHTLRIVFGRQSIAYDLNTVIDIETDDGTCLRTPAISQVVGLAPVSRWTLTISGEALTNTTFVGLRGIFGFAVGLGRWAGPVFVSGQVGAGQSVCAADVCGKDSNGQLRYQAALVADADLRLPLFTWEGPQASLIPSVGLHYGFASGSVPALAGAQRFSAHYLQAVLGFSMAGLTHGPFVQVPRASFYEFAIPFGVVMDPGGPDHRVAFAGGLQVRFVLPL